MEKKEYIFVSSRDWKFYLRPFLAEIDFANLCSLPRLELAQNVYPVVSSKNTEVRRFHYKGQVFFLKEYLFVGWKKHFKVLRRGWHLAQIARLMNSHGFLTPDVVGVGSCGIHRRVVTAAVENAMDVWDVLYPENNEYRGHVDDGFIYEFGRTIGSFHKCGFFHGDLRWRNVLVTKDNSKWNFYFIDNDRTKKFRNNIPTRCRIKNLSQVLFSGLLLKWPERDWSIFLDGYFEQSIFSPPDRKKLIAKVEMRANQRLDERRGLRLDCLGD